MAEAGIGISIAAVILCGCATTKSMKVDDEPQPATYPRDTQMHANEPPAPRSTPASSGLSREQILAVVLSHASEIQFCYERNTPDAPHVTGRVLLGWDVNTDGRAESVQVIDSSFRSPDAESCMARQVARWEFPKPSHLSKVQFPMMFKGRR